MTTDTRTKTAPRQGSDFSEFKRGWRVVLLGLFGICTSITAALLYAFGTLVIPLEQAFGWSRGDLQASITFLFAGVAISTQVVGWLYRRYGLRRVAIVSIVLQIVGYFAITQIQGSIGWLYLAFFAMPIVCAGTIAITWTQLVNLWFERNRGLALAIILCGTGLMAMVLPPLLSRLIAAYGWQAGFFALGAMPLLFTLPLALWWLRLPTDFSRPATGSHSAEQGKPLELSGMSFRQALRSGMYWGFNVALILSVSLTVGMVTNMVPMLQSKGLSPQEAAQVFSTFGISIIAGRLLVGYLLDRYSPSMVAAVSLVLPALGCAIFYFSGGQSLPLLVLATLCIGASAGAEFDLAAFLMARYFGLKDYARIFGLHLCLITIVSGLVPMLFGHLYDVYGSYSAVLVCCFCCAIIGPTILLCLKMEPAFLARRYAWQQQQPA
ncbi:MFS transporter [Pseudomonas sp. D5002]|uniref:MFS transporter n=1 Tax=unclassified Pseudomonas TaxID=196821 RepID=UPI00159F767B|nr:MFS transporter [Pseudomonas sp. D5002]NWB11421.1 MFS transporter [Pseudomonas sp. D5002]